MRFSVLLGLAALASAANEAVENNANGQTTTTTQNQQTTTTSQNTQNGQNGQTNTQTSTSSSSTSGSTGPQVDAIVFENLGYTGYYYDVKTLDTSSSCDCKLLSSWTSFTGTNAPLDEELSVHFRGPLKLHQFAFYTGDSFVLGSSLGSFERTAYYDASEGTADNVTFLTNAGDSSSCLGQALSYASDNGTGYASSSTVLANNTFLHSDDEFTIFSSSKCPSSGFSKSCGVYRSDIPAYHGFDGTVKMFLFEFEMPTETQANDSTSNYNMPAIWLLNAKIPRTSQYSSNSNCSCWKSGCGEFDIFEVLNTTEATHLFTTIHDYQGTGDINTGMSAQGHFYRDLNNRMLGGAVFDNDGNAIAFLSNSTTFDSTISASDLNDWINTDSEVTYELSSVTMNTSQSSEGVITSGTFVAWLVSLFSIFMYF